MRKLLCFGLLIIFGCEGRLFGLGPKADGTPASSPPGPNGCVGTAPLEAKLWRLSETQLRNSYRAALGAAYSDALVSPLRDGKASAQQLRLIASNLGFDGPQIVNLLGSVEKVGEAATRTLPSLAQCKVDACVESALMKLASDLWRRPALVDEMGPYTGAFAKARMLGGTHEESLTTAVTALLMSPRLTFRFEIGDSPAAGQTTKLSAHELASLLAFTITDAPPDAELRAAALDGSLLDPDGAKRHAQRLSATPEARQKLVTVVDDWLGYREISTVKKNPELLVTLTDGLRADLRRESELLVEHVAYERKGTLKDLLTFEGSLVNEQLASYYGIAGVKGSMFSATPDIGKRKGILNRGAFVAAFSNAGGTGMTHRANFILSHLFCSPPPPLMGDAVPPLPMPKPGERLTTRQRMEQFHSSQPKCMGCHKVLDPVGGSFESFDAIGRHRETEFDLPVDSSGSFELLDKKFAFKDNAGFISQLAEHPAVTQCFAQKSFAVLTGELATEQNACEVARFENALQKQNGSLSGLFAAIGGLSSLTERFVVP